MLQPRKMKEYIQQGLEKAAQALIPAAAWGMSMVVPIVPQFVWVALLNGILDEKVTLEHIQQFLKDHDIHTFSAPEDFPKEKSNFGG